MQAVAQSLVRRGHQVVWLTSADNEVRVRAVGATFVATEAIAIVDEPLMKNNETGILDKMYNRLEIRLLAQVSDYRRVLRGGFKPDLLLVDVMPYGARALYDLGEIPTYATLGVIPMYMSSWGAPQAVSGESPSTSLLWLIWNYLHHLISQWILLPYLLRPVINAQRQVLGLGNLPFGEPIESFTYSPFLHIQTSSPSLEFKLLPKPDEQKKHTTFVGPTVTQIQTDYVQLPPQWDEIVAHPRVVGITQGTLAMDPTSLIIPAIEALSNDPQLLLVVATPHVEEVTSRVGDLPNVRYVKWIPYHLFLPQLCLLITNGGYGSITQALSHKVPLICAGQSEDKKDTSARVDWAGAGIDLKTDTPSAEQVRKAARTILCDKGYAERAGRLGDELNELGGADRASELLEGLVDSKER
ncbi:udp-glucosyltransferase yojk [Fusarium sporotrichioides]|uniref:Udp-glucosyltransferase yojk n=1 Tax=Fusarium sporotrichioides TaxID=5514 RepID=A0A395RRK3_FUSSP|nr:udp-glucosyltransferase yojk [Fusarium sporotrichioides]